MKEDYQQASRTTMMELLIQQFVVLWPVTPVSQFRYKTYNQLQLMRKMYLNWSHFAKSIFYDSLRFNITVVSYAQILKKIHQCL